MTTGARETSSQRPDSRPPNVVLIVSDDYAFPFYGFMYPDEIKHSPTPHLDSLATEGGVFFDRGYVSAPHCELAHRSIVSGRNLRDTGEEPLGGPDRPTLPETLRDRFGYKTFSIGKWWQGPDGFFTYNDENGIAPNSNKAFARYYEQLQPAFDFIDCNGTEQPWFLWFTPNIPHDPSLSEKEFGKICPPPMAPPTQPLTIPSLGVTANLDYLRTICALDFVIGRLIDHINSKTGLRDQTLILYLTDNGAKLAKSKRPGLPEAGIRTPIIVNHKSVQGCGRQPAFAGCIDLYRTILDFAGDDTAPKWDGKPGKWTDSMSLRPLVGPQATRSFEPKWRRHVLFSNRSRVRGGDSSVRDETHKLYMNAAGKPRQLYDLRTDPLERNNLLDGQGKAVDDAAQEARDRLSPILLAWTKKEYKGARGVEQLVATTYAQTMAAHA